MSTDPRIEAAAKAIAKVFDLAAGPPHNRKPLRMDVDAATAALAAIDKAATIETSDEVDTLPFGTVVLDVDGNTARRFPGGWRTTVVEPNGDAWLSGHMEDPDLPARVLHWGTE